MNAFAISSLLCGSSSFVLAIFSFLAGRSLAYRLLMLFNLSVAIWGFGCFMVATSQNEGSGLIGWKVAHLGGTFIAPIFYHLVTVLYGIRRQGILVLGYLQGVILNTVNFISDLVMDRVRVAFGFFYNEATPLYTVGVLIFLLLIALSYFELTKTLKTADGYKKVQVRYVFFGFLIGFACGTTTLLPEFGMDMIYPIGNIGVFIYAAILAYAILRLNILDLDAVARAAQREKLSAIGILASSINHEIRNPLYVIKGLAECLIDNLSEDVFSTKEEMAAKTKEVLQKSSEQAVRAMDIMKRFAQFAKQRAREEARFEKVDLEETLEGVLPLVRHELELDKIELIKEIPSHLPPVYVDRRHIEEIFFNLIVNACQAMRNGGKLTVHAEQQNGSIQVEIKDDGPGIPPDQLRRIFEPFYTTKESGTGLGLYITKQLIERNDGKISVRSKEGEGASFVLNFRVQ